MDSNTWGKVCLVGCLVFVILALIAGAGCLYCTMRYGKGLISASVTSARINEHFTDLQNRGWDVKFNEPPSMSFQAEPQEFSQEIIYQARQNPDEEWTEYIWEMRLSESGQTTQNLLDWEIVPVNEAALEVHTELELPLPENYALEQEGDDSQPGRLRDTLRKEREEAEESGEEESKEVIDIPENTGSEN